MAALGHKDFGRAQSGKGHGRMKLPFRCLSTMGLCVCLALVLSSFVSGQSGRRKEKNPNPPVSKARPGPIAEPTSSPTPSGKGASTANGSTDEVDPNDVVRISS